MRREAGGWRSLVGATVKLYRPNGWLNCRPNCHLCRIQILLLAQNDFLFPLRLLFSAEMGKIGLFTTLKAS